MKKYTGVIVGVVVILAIVSAVILTNGGIALADMPRGG